MKTKNLALALVAMVFAVGSAFASYVFATETVYVKGRPLNQPTAPIECFDTGKTCITPGANACAVTVNVQTGSNLASSASGSTFRTYKDIDECGIVIASHNSSTVQASSLSINRLEP